MFVYDVTDIHSFDQVAYLIAEVDRYNNDLKKVLVANKIDNENHEVPSEKGRKLAEEHNLRFIETSAITGEGVDD